MPDAVRARARPYLSCPVLKISSWRLVKPLQTIMQVPPPAAFVYAGKCARSGIHGRFQTTTGPRGRAG